MTYIVETEIPCPWCGEYFPTTVDTSQGDYNTIEDCAVCCRPISIAVRCEPGELHDVQAERG
ncbi:MAG TPA: CPXCG motif-containing cysteine-rich protein [Chthoniobacter sp.]|nr:CPXCG motif-containing cysteine-rich protein [Chthoniobacter sp.]